MRQFWTNKETDFLKANYLLPPKQIAHKLKKLFDRRRTPEAVYCKLKALDLYVGEEVRKARIIKTHRDKQDANKPTPYPGASPLVIVFLAHQHRLTKRVRGITPKKTPLHIVLDDIARVFNLSLDNLRSGRRISNELSMYRFIFYYVARRMHPEISLIKLAKFLKYKEHTVVLHGIKQVEGWLEVSDPRFMQLWSMYLKLTDVFVAYDPKRKK